MNWSRFSFVTILCLCALVAGTIQADMLTLTVELNNDIKVFSLPVTNSGGLPYVNLEACFHKLGGQIFPMLDQIEATLADHTATLSANHREVALLDNSFILSSACLLLDDHVSLAVQDLESFFLHGYGIAVKTEPSLSPGQEDEFLDIEGDGSLLLETVDSTSIPALEDLEGEEKEGKIEGEASEASTTDNAVEGQILDFAHLSSAKGLIVLDPAHGGSQPGISPGDGLHEKDILLTLAQSIKTILEENTAIEVLLTRNDDSSVSLGKRKSVAEKAGADFLISLESGYSFESSRQGMILWIDGEAGASDNSNHREDNRSSQRVKLSEKARQVGKTFHHHLGMDKDLGAVDFKQAPLILQREVNLPVLLLETGYLSNPQTLAFMQDEGKLHRISFSIAWAIAESLK